MTFVDAVNTNQTNMIKQTNMIHSNLILVLMALYSSSDFKEDNDKDYNYENCNQGILEHSILLKSSLHAF